MGITEKQVWLALHKQFSSKPEVLKKIGEVCENVGHLSFSIPEGVSIIDGGKYTADISIALEHLDDVRNDLDELERNEVHVIPFTDERYPEKLKEIARFPPLLYAMGNLSLLNKASIGICGSRGATEWDSVSLGNSGTSPQRKMSLSLAVMPKALIPLPIWAYSKAMARR